MMTNQEAIKILDNLKPGDYSNPYEKGEAIVMAISALRALDKIIEAWNRNRETIERQWIPVSERLPESKHEDLEYPTVIVCCGDGAVTLACYYESTKEWGTGEYYDRIINPVAWMPLPEPYAERRTDE